MILPIRPSAPRTTSRPLEISLALVRPNVSLVHATSTAIRLTKSWNSFACSATPFFPRDLASGAKPARNSSVGGPLRREVKQLGGHVDRPHEMRCDSCARRTFQFAVPGVVSVPMGDVPSPIAAATRRRHSSRSRTYPKFAGNSATSLANESSASRYNFSPSSD